MLTAVAASTDAISYLGLGKVFPANMTGNTVLLGVGIASGDYGGAGRSAVALGGFVVGAVCAGALTRVLMPALAMELVVLGAACGLWLSAGDELGFAVEHVLIGLVGVAMGVQSAAVSRLDVGVSTTFITGTWTAVSTRCGSWLRRRHAPPAPPNDRTGRQALVLAVYAAAALGSGFAEHAAKAPAALTPVGLLLIALAGRLPGHAAGTGPDAKHTS